MPSIPVTGTSPARPSWRRGLEGADGHAVIGGPDPLDLVTEAGEPGLHDLEGLGLVPIGRLEVEDLDLAAGGLHRLLHAELALDGGDVGEDAADGDNAALATHGADQRLGDGLGGGDTVERHVGDIVRDRSPRDGDRRACSIG